MTLLLWMPVLPLFVGEAATNRYALFYHWGLQYVGGAEAGAGAVEHSVTERIVQTPDLYFSYLFPTFALLIIPFYVSLGLVRASPGRNLSFKLAVMFGMTFLAVKRTRTFWSMYVRKYGQFSVLASPCGLWLHIFIVVSVGYELARLVRHRQR